MVGRRHSDRVTTGFCCELWQRAAPGNSVTIIRKDHHRAARIIRARGTMAGLNKRDTEMGRRE